MSLGVNIKTKLLMVTIQNGFYGTVSMFNDVSHPEKNHSSPGDAHLSRFWPGVSICPSLQLCAYTLGAKN